MNNIKVYDSIVNQEIFKEFEEQRGIDLFNHANNSCMIDDALALAYVFCPDFVKVKDYIFIADFFDAQGEDAIKKVESLERQFNGNKQQIEQMVNSWSIGDFFLGCDSPSMDNDKIVNQFCEVLVYNWKRRVLELFPEKKIIVEVGNEIMGELGLTITLYEATL